MKIIFATNNKHKLEEVSRVLNQSFTLITPKEVGVTQEIPETSDTLEGNASQKSHFLYNITGQDCFADDTGLEVEALGGAPGVHSARYASQAGNDSEANMALLLKNMEGAKSRKARFRTVISLIWQGKEYLFEGVVNGEIVESRRGGEGFGYDPIFVPEGGDRTFAQMDLDEKNKISHRGIAIEKLAQFLKNNQ